MNGENHELFNSHEDAKILKTASLMKAGSRHPIVASDWPQPSEDEDRAKEI
jgi:hypothetical protein